MKVAWILVSALCWFPSICARERKVMRIDDSFDGRHVELHVGETLEITLSENASTGFRWVSQPEAAHKFEKVLRQTESAAEGMGGVAGKPGVRHFSFEAYEPGTAEMELHYRRPWEGGKPPARNFKLYIRVRPASNH